MAAPEQQVLETRLNELEELARNKMAKYPTLREGQAKDVETSLEQDFGGMRRVIRDLESLAEDQEEEDDEEVVQRLQQYKRKLQGLQVALTTAKLQPKTDSYEENRKQLLAGADPMQRQRELQTEADMLGAAQKTTSSLQRSRQVMLQQIDNQQNVLAAMDASHEQLAKTTEEYQGQSSVYGNTRQLLRTMKRHSSWDKLILYGGFAMFMLVCLYIVQKRSVYFVPTFVKTGLGRLVPSWSRLSSRDVDQLVKERQQAPEGLKQKPNLDTLRNADQAAELLQRQPTTHASNTHLGAAQATPGTATTDQAAAQHPALAQAAQQRQVSKPETMAQAAEQGDVAAQAVHAAVGATADIVQQLDTQEQEAVRAAVASAAQRVAQQQEQQASMMSAGQAYPQAQSGMLMEPQNTSQTTHNSSHATLSQLDDAAELTGVDADQADDAAEPTINVDEASDPAELTSINADDATEPASIKADEAGDPAELTSINADEAGDIQQLGALEQPSPVLEGSLPGNVSHDSEPEATDSTPSVGQSGSPSLLDEIPLSDAASSSEASDATPATDATAATAAAQVPDPVVSEADHASFEKASQTVSATPGFGEAESPTSPQASVDATPDNQQGSDRDRLGGNAQPVTLAANGNVTGAAQPQSSTNFSSDAEVPKPDGVHSDEDDSTPAVSKHSTLNLSAAVINQTLYEEELAALTKSVRSKRHADPSKLSLPLQHADNIQQGQQSFSDASGAKQQEDDADVDLQPGTPERSIEERIQQSGHAEAFEHIMQSIPDFIRNAGADSDVADGSKPSDQETDDQERLSDDYTSVGSSQTSSNSSGSADDFVNTVG